MNAAEDMAPDAAAVAEAQDEAGVVRRASLPGGRTLVVRSVTDRDIDGLTALYAGLDDEARYRRFFSMFRPDRDFFARMAAVGERGGAGLVATVAGPDAAEERIVAEAGYELLPNGNGELEITVDERWRGWLGPYLLDALADTAAARGVANLEADILMTNGPMVALFRARGHVAVPTEDWSVVRAMIGTATRTPTWSPSHRLLRVLVEGAGGHWHAAEAAKEAGMEVLGCPGPEGRRTRCPALDGEPCPLAAGADAIVMSHPPDTEEWSRLRAAHPRLHAGVPVCVEVAADGTGAGPDETAVLPCAAHEVVAIVQRVARAGPHS